METLLQMPFLGIGQGLATGQSKLGNSLEAETKPSEGSGEQEGAGLSFPSLLILQTLGTDVKGPLLEDAVAKNPEATTSSPQPGKMEGQPRLSSEIKPVPGSGSVNLTIETLPSVENAHSPNQVLPGQQNNLGIATGNLVNPALAPALTPAQSGLFDMA
ncbi:MAG: hypothetical protein KOO60_13500, partial [Gemmatimonadales bacterium]|nr:hypothetical protein [Gemmatimonadales bacterium]